MDDFLQECPDSHLLNVDISILRDKDPTPNEGTHLLQPGDLAAYSPPSHLVGFSSEECFDWILRYLTSIPDKSQSSGHNSIIGSYTRKRLDSTALFSICSMLQRASNGYPDTLPGIPTRTSPNMDSGWDLDSKILPRVLRCIRPWRLADPWARSDIITIGENGGVLADSDLVELAMCISGLANNPRDGLEERSGGPGPGRLKIRWLGRVDTDVCDTESVYLDEGTTSSYVSPPTSNELEPEVQLDGPAKEATPGDASLFRSGCIACHRPRNALCSQTCDEKQPGGMLSTNSRLLNINLENRHPTSDLPPGAQHRTYRRSIPSRGTKAVTGPRTKPVNYEKTNTKENMPPAIPQTRRQDTSVPSNTTLPSLRAHESRGQVTIPSFPAQPTRSSDLNPHEPPRCTVRSLLISHSIDNSVTHPPICVKTKPNPEASTSRSSGPSRPASRVQPRLGKEKKGPTQPTRSISTPLGINENPSLEKTRKDRCAVILGQRNR